ncbi:MAG: type VI secretion system tip protein VgrG [Phaeodactylibacter sp.]|nr:type VI secretion system tip protein VgrG [Phaeodactylibacter sp.]
MINGRLIPNSTRTDVVTHTIKINGEAISRRFQVMSILVMRELNRIPYCRINMIDGNAATQDFPVSAEDLFVPGNEIEALLGYYAEESTVFKGIITGHSIKVRRGGAQLTVDCKDAAVKMAIAARSRYFLDVKDSDIMEELASGYGLDADIEATDVTHAELVQYELTDWDLLISRAQANGRVCLVNDGLISVLKPSLDSEPVLEAAYGSSSLEEFDAEIDARYQYSSVLAKSWDYAGQEVLEAEAADPGFEEAGNLSAAQLADVVGLDPPLTLYHGGQVVQEELQAWADAQLILSRLARLRGRVKFQGYAAILPGETIQLSGVGPRMSGKVYVSGIRHEYAGGNWYTDAQFGLDADFFTRTHKVNAPRAGGLLGAVSGLQAGVVTQLEEDPDGENRIRVKLPIVNPDDDGVWARVATLDAGENRGTFFLPEVGDEVIVGFINDDPRDPVVLGMLNSSAKPAPFTASNDNHEKGLVTRSEMKCVFNDDLKSISLETPAGNTILLSEDEGGISLADENGNKIVLNSDGITLESAKDIILKASGDIKAEGVNIESKASAQFKAEGQAGLEVSSSAVAVLKGSLVQIN